MKLTKNAIDILKNFSGINPGITYDGGDKLKTCLVNRSMIASAKLDQKIGAEFSIYEINQFLSLLSLINDPDVEFKDDRAIISGTDRKFTYNYCSREVLVSPPDSFSFEDGDVNFDLAHSQLNDIIKSASALGVEDILFIGDGSKVLVTAKDAENSSSNTFELSLNQKTKEFKARTNLQNLKLLPYDYNVNVSENILHFRNEDADVDYWIAQVA
jgi:hypothetical protein